MKHDGPVEIGAYPESRVRWLGFDPSYLTPEEQVELLELHSSFPDESPEEVGVRCRRPATGHPPSAVRFRGPGP